MRITEQFRRFYFGAIIGDIYEQMVQRKRIKMTSQKLRYALRELDPKYPRYDGDVLKSPFAGTPVSLTDISSKHLTDHLEFIRLWASSYGVTLKIDDEEWERMIELAKAYDN